MRPHAFLQHTIWKPCSRGKCFLGFRVFFLISPRGKTFLQVSSKLFNVWHTCLGTSCAVLYIYPLTLASHGWFAFIFILLSLCKVGVFVWKHFQKFRQYNPFFCNKLQLHFSFLFGSNGAFFCQSSKQNVHILSPLTFTSPLWFLLMIWTFISCSN